MNYRKRGTAPAGSLWTFKDCKYSLDWALEIGGATTTARGLYSRAIAVWQTGVNKRTAPIWDPIWEPSSGVPPWSWPYHCTARHRRLGPAPANCHQTNCLLMYEFGPASCYSGRQIMLRGTMFSWKHSSVWAIIVIDQNKQWKIVFVPQIKGQCIVKHWKDSAERSAWVEQVRPQKNTVPKKGAVQSTVTQSVSAEPYSPRGSIEHNTLGGGRAEHSAPGGQWRVQCIRGALIMQCTPWVVQSTVLMLANIVVSLWQYPYFAPGLTCMFDVFNYFDDRLIILNNRFTLQCSRI